MQAYNPLRFPSQKEGRLESCRNVMEELRQVGPKPEDPTWGDVFKAEVDSEEFFRLIVHTIWCHKVTNDEFLWLDRQSITCGKVSRHHARWGWKFRRCRNHPVWGLKLIEALQEVEND